MSNVKTLFENYHVIVGELEASLYVMSKYLELDMKEASLAKQVKRINACAEFLDGDQFIQVELINKRYKEFCFLTWAIQSRPEKQRKILEGIYINGQSWSNIQDELFISSSSLSRERKKAFDALELVWSSGMGDGNIWK